MESAALGFSVKVLLTADNVSLHLGKGLALYMLGTENPVLTTAVN